MELPTVYYPGGWLNNSGWFVGPLSPIYVHSSANKRTVSAQYYATIAGLTVTASTAATSQMSFDDVLAIARRFADKPREQLVSAYSSAIILTSRQAFHTTG